MAAVGLNLLYMGVPCNHVVLYRWSIFTYHKFDSITQENTTLNVIITG